ncbi:EamA family transporter, partial [Klebsiella pneumoniae]|uniref:EamA family transporter n=2 Tax=Pseudomonadota TaxID=1224 RepID=UPI0018EA1CAF
MTLAIETPPARTAVNLALLVLLATLWGAAYTLVKIGVETIPPLTFISGRTLIAGGILLAIMALRG